MKDKNCDDGLDSPADGSFICHLPSKNPCSQFTVAYNILVVLPGFSYSIDSFIEQPIFCFTRIRHVLFQEDRDKLVHAIVTSRDGYCNSIF